MEWLSCPKICETTISLVSWADVRNAERKHNSVRRPISAYFIRSNCASEQLDRESVVVRQCPTIIPIHVEICVYVHSYGGEPSGSG